jgi:hypothetical protein
MPAAAGSSSGSGGGSQGLMEQQAAAAAAGVVSAVGFVAAVRHAVADAPTGEAQEEVFCFSTAICNIHTSSEFLT